MLNSVSLYITRAREESRIWGMCLRLTRVKFSFAFFSYFEGHYTIPMSEYVLNVGVGRRYSRENEKSS